MSTTYSITKSYRLTSKYANKGKRELIYRIFDEVYEFKNEMSEYIYSNLSKLLSEPKGFISNYRKWNSNLLPAHTIQTLFSDITKLYINHVKQIVNNSIKKIHIQDIRFSKRKKQYVFEFKNTAICKLIKYLVKIQSKKLDFIKSISDVNIAKAGLFDVWNNLDDKKKEIVIKIVNSRIKRIRKRIKKIQFKNGTFRLTNTGYSFEIIIDESNTKFKVFLKLRLKNYVVFLPLLIDLDEKNPRTKAYFEKILNGELNKQIFLIDRHNVKNTKKLFFAISKEETLTFSDFGRIVGCDVNLTSEKFIVCSNGDVCEFDESIMQEFLAFITKIDEKGYQNLTNKEKRKLRKLTNKVKWYIDYQIARLINTLKDKGYTDIVLEDLELFNNGKFAINLFGYKLKLNRFVRFLHLTGLKERFKQIAHNRGVRVHLTKASYTSQQCPNCGHIDKNNRKSQSKFKCTNCGYTHDADHNASINILLRYLNNTYKEKLHKTNNFDELETKPGLNTNQIKSILIKNFKHPLDVLEDFYNQVLSSGFLVEIVYKVNNFV